jgi:hypothetical protein
LNLYFFSFLFLFIHPSSFRLHLFGCYWEQFARVVGTLEGAGCGDSAGAEGRATTEEGQFAEDAAKVEAHGLGREVRGGRDDVASVDGRIDYVDVAHSAKAGDALGAGPSTD